MNASPKQLRKRLEQIANNPQDSLRKEVALEALNHSYENIRDFFVDLLTHGCASGMVSGLIYYSDTRDFYDTYYYEIEELRQQVEDDMGEPLQIRGDLKNFLAWFAFEQTAYLLANELELEV